MATFAIHGGVSLDGKRLMAKSEVSVAGRCAVTRDGWSVMQRRRRDAHLRGLELPLVCVTSAKRIPAALGCRGFSMGSSRLLSSLPLAAMQNALVSTQRRKIQRARY